MRKVTFYALVSAVVAFFVLTPSTASAAAVGTRPTDTLGPFTDTLGCGEEITKDDHATGTLNLRFLCLGDKGVVNWSFTISPQVRALIGAEVEPVAEDGMFWWRNGVPQAKNSDHRRASTYQFHGTLSPVGINEKIEYMDNFRFTTTDGRRGNIAVAGVLYLKQ